MDIEIEFVSEIKYSSKVQSLKFSSSFKSYNKYNSMISKDFYFILQSLLNINNCSSVNYFIIVCIYRYIYLTKIHTNFNSTDFSVKFRFF